MLITMSGLSTTPSASSIASMCSHTSTRRKLQGYLEAMANHPDADMTVLVVGADTNSSKGSTGDAVDQRISFPASSKVVRSCCSCAQGLPEDTSDSRIWDLTCLLINSKVVSQQVVLTWLGLVHSAVGQCIRPKLSSTLQETMELLQFADAVGTNLPLMEAWAEGIQMLDVVYGNTTITLDLSSQYIIYTDHTMKQGSPATLVTNLGDMNQFRKAACGIIEHHLYIASKLGLTQLVKKLFAFIDLDLKNHGCGGSVFQSIETVLTPRVLSVLPYEMLVEVFVMHKLAACRDGKAAVVVRQYEESEV